MTNQPDNGKSDAISTQIDVIDNITNNLRYQVLQNADQVELVVGKITKEFTLETKDKEKLRTLIEEMIKFPVRRNMGLLKKVSKTLRIINQPKG